MAAWAQDDLDRIASRMRKIANFDVWTGREADIYGSYFRSCYRRAYGTNLIFTRDVGHHTSGWFKNPDYEQCYHLSTSAAPSQVWTRDTPDLDRKLIEGWLRAFFRDDLRYVWAESPKTKEGKQHGVWHWRLFCDEHWIPLLPRGEVYSLEFTEKGWKSASELGYQIISPLVPG